MNLTKYITERQLTSLLLVGCEGFSMMEDALALAEHLLSTKRVEEHTDFLLVSPLEGKKSIGVDEVMPIIQKGTMPPVHGKFSVVIIDGMEKLTVTAQNKLLVLLESNPYVFVVGIAYGDAVLDTVKSRMRIIPYQKCSKEEFCSLTSDCITTGDAELFYHATGGCPGLLSTLQSDMGIFLSIKQVCSTDAERVQLLKILHLLKEKDTYAVTSDMQLVACIIRTLQFIFQERAVFAYGNNDVGSACRYLDIVERLLADERRCGKPSYTKDDFFETIVFCVEH